MFVSTRRSLPFLCIWNTIVLLLCSLPVSDQSLVAVPLSLLVLDVEMSQSISSRAVTAVLARMWWRTPDSQSTPQPFLQASAVPIWLPTVPGEQQLDQALHVLPPLVGVAVHSMAPPSSWRGRDCSTNTTEVAGLLSLSLWKRGECGGQWVRLPLGGMEKHVKSNFFSYIFYDIVSTVSVYCC